MSRTIRGNKSFGFDFGSARPGNLHYCGGFGPELKKKTHRSERRNSKLITRIEVMSL